MNGERNDEILGELRRLTKLMAYTLIKDHEQRDQIEFLNKIGFQRNEISELLGITPNAVSIALHRMRKQTAQTKKGKLRKKADGNK